MKIMKALTNTFCPPGTFESFSVKSSTHFSDLWAFSYLGTWTNKSSAEFSGLAFMRLDVDISKPSGTSKKLYGHVESSSLKILWQYFKTLSCHGCPSKRQK